MRINGIIWGNPEISDYDLILDYFSGTKIHSIKTSSVPLAQYWKQTEKRITSVSRILNENLHDVDIYFEYPTRSLGRSKSSMSDIMIFAKNIKIAIEGKYTEYKKTNYQEINNWLKENKEYRLKVLDHWKEMIIPFVNSSLDINEIGRLPYQFFHRTASACFDNTGKAYVLYQLFWDDDTKSDLDKFKSLINKAADSLCVKDNLRIILQNIKIKNINKCNIKDVFQIMKSSNIYEFQD